jgi:hypothetical protein
MLDSTGRGAMGAAAINGDWSREELKKCKPSLNGYDSVISVGDNCNFSMGKFVRVQRTSSSSEIQEEFFSRACQWIG